MSLGGISNLGLSVRKILQISMDGPNVNFSFLREFKKYIEDEDSTNENPIFIDIGSCSLHIVHGAYKTAHNKTTWNINQFLRSAYYLFKDHPSRRSDYIHYSKATVFPQKMCSIRWVENASVIDRAIKVIPNLRKYIDGVKTKPPQTKNYEIIKKCLADEFLGAKLSFMLTVALQLEPFLTTFQSNKPLLPFMYGDLFSLMKNIFNRFVKKEKMDTVKNGQHLLDLDVENSANLLTAKDIDIGFGASAACKGKKEVDVLRFKNECRQFLMALSVKLIAVA